MNIDLNKYDFRQSQFESISFSSGVSNENTTNNCGYILVANSLQSDECVFAEGIANKSVL